LDKGGRGELDEALSLVADSYDLAEPQVWDASEFGAATRRKRVFVIGTLKGSCAPISAEDIEMWKRPAATVLDAIGDLASATYVEQDERDLDLWQLGDHGASAPYARSLRSNTGRTSGLRLTAHQQPVVERFAKVKQGGTDPIGRHPRLSWNQQCPTLRAGTGSDKGSYQSVRPIHPTENRVITVREAARLQGFPDDHQFHPTIWHSFRMIGNSVAPMMAEAVFRGIMSKFQSPPTMPASKMSSTE
jgi:DNA (cytosine-5)-methyltransferase 1